MLHFLHSHLLPSGSPRAAPGPSSSLDPGLLPALHTPSYTAAPPRQALLPGPGRFAAQTGKGERQRMCEHLLFALPCVGYIPVTLASHEAGKVETSVHTAQVGKLRLGEENDLHNSPQPSIHTWQKRKLGNNVCPLWAPLVSVRELGGERGLETEPWIW